MASTDAANERYLQRVVALMAIAEIIDLPLVRIADHLNALGVTPPCGRPGGRWYAKTVSRLIPDAYVAKGEALRQSRRTYSS